MHMRNSSGIPGVQGEMAFVGSDLQEALGLHSAAVRLGET